MELQQDVDKEYEPGLPQRLSKLLGSMFRAIIFFILILFAIAGIGMTFAAFRGTQAVMFSLFWVLAFVVSVMAMTYYLWFGTSFMTRTFVIVSDDGIELQCGGICAFTPWDNISHIDVKGSGNSQQHGIYLHNKIKPEVNGWVEKLLYSSETDFLPIGEVINLPTRWGLFHYPIDYEKLADTEFGQDLLNYAPHLLQEPDEDK
jgi:hypothetical protein